MTLYKATDKGNVPLDADEEVALRAEWAKSERVSRVKAKTIDEIVADLKVELDLLKVEVDKLKAM